MSFAWCRSRAGRLFVALSLVALALASARAQQDAGAPPQPSDQQDEERDIGWISGRVIGPTGLPENGGTVSLSTDGGVTLRYNITVSPNGDYTGREPLGEYTLVYRAPGTPDGKVTDYIHSVVILAGKGTPQDVDMTREEYFDRLSPEEQVQLQQIKESNQKALAAHTMIASINADLQAVSQDFADIATARVTAIQTLGSTAAPSDVDSTVDEIREDKYTDIESRMCKAAAAWPDEATLWVYLGRAQVGLKNYLDAETSFKKAVDLTAQPGNPGLQAENPAPLAAKIDPQLAAAALAGLGEVYARTLMVDEANASFVAAVKADPAHAATYLRNLAVIYFQQKNASAQIDAADDALKANPNDPLLYFIKAQGLAVDAPVDPDTNKLKLSPECAAAFQKYLELAPAGEYAAKVTTILQSAGLLNPNPQNATTQNTGSETTPASPPVQTTSPAQK